MAASVNELASFEGVDLVSRRDGVCASIIDWSFTEANFSEAFGMDHLNSGNQRGTNASVSPICFAVDRSMIAAEWARRHGKRRAGFPCAAFCLNIRKD
jgi:hypothetical protein